MSSKSNSPAQQRVKNALAALPLAFEVNHGQTGQEVKYLSHGRGYVLFLCEKEAVFSLQKPRKLEKGRPSGAETPPAVLRLAFVGSNPHPAISGASELPGKSNYFFGNRSITDVTTYSKVAYAGLYPGIDAVYYGNQKQLEYDFVVAPGANPAAIKLAVTGAEKAEVDARGDLVLTVTGKEVRQHKPVLYQVAGGVKSEVAGRYVLQGESGPGTRMVSFEVAKYDPSKPLVIDPVLVYSTFYGDLPSTEAAPSDLSGDDGGMGIALDSAGNAYVTGFTNSFEFPVLSWLQDYTYSAAYGIDHPPTLLQYLEVPNRPGAYHAFLSKFNQDSSQLVYSTYWGGGRDDVGVAVAVGSDNAPVVAGTTNSSSFNLKNALHVYAGGIDTFITKFTPGGNDVVFSTLLGGEFDDVCNDLALDSAGNVFVVGTTTSPNLSTANPLQPRNNSTAPNGSNGFVAKFRADGLVMLFCTYLGGHNNDGAMGVTTDASGNCYVVGFTTSPDFPLASPLQPQNNSTAPVPSNAFVAKLNPSGSLLVFSTYLGGSGEDQANSVAVDAGGNVYLAGYTKSSDFPTISPTVLPVQATNGGPPGTKDAFVSKISYLGNALLFSTYLGGAGDDEARRIVVDSRGAIYVAGSTQSDDFPLAPQTNTLQSARAKGVSGLSKSNADGFLAKFNPSGTPLVYSTYLGSTAHSFLTDNMVRAVPPILPVALDTWSEVRGLVTDNQGNAYVTGFTEGEFYHTFDAYSDIAPLPPAPGDKYPAPFKATITFPDGSVMPDPSEAIGDLAYLLGIQSGPISRMLPKSPVVGATSPRIVTGALQPAGTVSGVAALQLDGQWVYGIDDRDVYLAKIGDTSPLITSPQTLNVTVGAYINYIVTATNYPTSFNAAGLPPGLFISTSTGQIAGTTSVTGTFPVVLTASNAGGTGSQILVLNVSSQAPAIYSPLAATATVGKVFTYNIQAHFAPASFDAKSQPTSFDAQGQLIGLPLPTGLTVDTLSGFISGVPLNEAQTNVTITATNSWGHDAQTLVLTVMPAAPVITSAAVAQGVLNQPFSYTITATGNPTSYTAAQLPPATGLPPGLTLDPGTGVISGTPTTLGNFSVALTATNGGGTGTGQLSLSIIPGLVPIISSPDTAFAAVGRPFSYTITANNNPQAFSITVDATVTAVASGTQFTAAGLINEGPFVGHPLTVVSGAAVNQTVTITAFDRSTGALTVNSALAGLTGGDTFYVRALPLQLEPNFLDGLTLDTTLGLLSGTPTVNSAGRPFHLTLRATNAAGTGTKVLQLIVYKPERPFISSPDTATATVGTAFEYDIAANGPTTAATGQVSAFFVPVQFTSANLINKGPFVGQTLKLTSGAGVGQTWTVNAFAPATGTCTLNRPFSGAVGDTFTFPALFSSTGLITQPPLALAGLTLRMTSGAAINQTWTVNAFNPPTGTCALNSVFTGAIGDTFTFISPQFFSNNLSGPGPFVGLTLTMTSGAALNQTWTINAFNAISGTFTLNSNFTGATNDNFSINTVPAATTGSVTGLVPPAGTPGTVTSLPGGTVSSVPSSGFSSTDLLNSGPFASQTMSMKSGAAINIVWTITSFDPLTGTITLDKFFGGGVGDNFSINIPSVTNLPANAVNGFVTTLNSQTIFQSDHLKGVTPAAVLLNYPNNFTMTSGLNAGTGATKTVTAFDPTTGT
ncbi:MAG: SBBP repeat-containing protein, partial [Planctomycetota bacterium]